MPFRSFSPDIFQKGGEASTDDKQKPPHCEEAAVFYFATCGGGYFMAV
jgi:hypothetical protein